VAFWGGGAVRRFLPDGTLDEVVAFPAELVTSCAFGGSGGEDLYVTSAREGLKADELREQPLAGGLFRVRPGVTGPPATLVDDR
jgi:sugar lactone lactonase YvrE